VGRACDQKVRNLLLYPLSYRCNGVISGKV
jgi:hypothetical protein